MFSAPSSPQPASSTSSDSSPISPPSRKARALYACKAEHESELSFIAGTIFENAWQLPQTETFTPQGNPAGWKAPLTGGRG
ncbi:hypothetical protein JZ751_022538 [Albula glossodonta]|uniref:Uncharacterized protein n=1 Tax=Albula glossodonta TaxID=121402 RepID=A0A8T2PFK9_9TELE|nr:hypothetical protein JZ751_022538 [Albula glossodonta]